MIMICDKHGEYESKVTQGGLGVFRSYCPNCLKEAAVNNEMLEMNRTKERLKVRIKEMIKAADIPKRFTECSFDNYVAKTKEVIAAVKGCEDFVRNYEENSKTGASLFLCGTYGTGKTHLAIAILRELMIANRGSGKYTTTLRMIRDIRSSYSREVNQTEQQIIDKYVNQDLLILDEVGLQYGTDSEKILLFDVINGRYEEMKPTILISNLGVDGIKVFMGERIFDRLTEGKSNLIVMDWESYRK